MDVHFIFYVVKNCRVPVLIAHSSEHRWVVVEIMAPFWSPYIIRNLLFRVVKKGPLF